MLRNKYKQGMDAIFGILVEWSEKEIQWVSVNCSLFGKLEEIRAARKVNRTFGRGLKKRLGIDWERHWFFQESQCSSILF